MAGVMRCRRTGRAGWKTRPGQWLPKCSVEVYLRTLDKLFGLWHTPRRGYRLATCSTFPWGSEPVITYDYGWAVKMKKKDIRKAAQESKHSHLAAIESTLFSSIQSIVSHLSVTRYDDGDTRQPGTMILKTQGSAWVVVLKDPDSCAQMQCLGQTLDEALILAALMLDSEDAPWENDPWAKRGKTQGKK